MNRPLRHVARPPLLPEITRADALAVFLSRHHLMMYFTSPRHPLNHRQILYPQERAPSALHTSYSFFPECLLSSRWCDSTTQHGSMTQSYNPITIIFWKYSALSKWAPSDRSVTYPEIFRELHDFFFLHVILNGLNDRSLQEFPWRPGESSIRRLCLQCRSFVIHFEIMNHHWKLCFTSDKSTSVYVWTLQVNISRNKAF